MAPSVRAMLDDQRATPAVLDFLRDTLVGMMISLAPREEKEGGRRIVRERRAGRASPRYIFPVSFLCFFSFVRLSLADLGIRRMGALL